MSKCPNCGLSGNLPCGCTESVWAQVFTKGFGRLLVAVFAIWLTTTAVLFT